MKHQAQLDMAVLTTLDSLKEACGPSPSIDSPNGTNVSISDHVNPTASHDPQVPVRPSLSTMETSRDSARAPAPSHPETPQPSPAHAQQYTPQPINITNNNITNVYPAPSQDSASLRSPLEDVNHAVQVQSLQQPQIKPEEVCELSTKASANITQLQTATEESSDHQPIASHATQGHDVPPRAQSSASVAQPPPPQPLTPDNIHSETRNLALERRVNTFRRSSKKWKAKAETAESLLSEVELDRETERAKFRTLVIRVGETEVEKGELEVKCRDATTLVGKLKDDYEVVKGDKEVFEKRIKEIEKLLSARK